MEPITTLPSMKAATTTSAIVFLMMIVMASTSSAQDAGSMSASKIIQDWPKASQMPAQKMIDKYGTPDEFTMSRLIWYGNGDWDETIIRREPIDHSFPVPHKDVLYQEIKYDVPDENFDELAEYDGSVIVEDTKGTIAARCDKERANYLAINLAHEIIEGEKSVEEARQFYAETVKQMMQGKSSKYLKGFIFEVPREQTADPDEALIKMSQMKKKGEM